MVVWTVTCYCTIYRQFVGCNRLCVWTVTPYCTIYRPYVDCNKLCFWTVMRCHTMYPGNMLLIANCDIELCYMTATILNCGIYITAPHRGSQSPVTHCLHPVPALYQVAASLVTNHTSLNMSFSRLFQQLVTQPLLSLQVEHGFKCMYPTLIWAVSECTAV